jgi:hypothetical protein
VFFHAPLLHWEGEFCHQGKIRPKNFPLFGGFYVLEYQSADEALTKKEKEDGR